MEQVLGHFQPNVLSVSKTTSDAGLRALCCVCVGVCLFIFAVRRNGTVFNQKRIKDEKTAHLQSSVFKLSKDLIDSIHEEGIVAYTS